MAPTLLEGTSLICKRKRRGLAAEVVVKGTGRIVELLKIQPRLQELVASLQEKNEEKGQLEGAFLWSEQIAKTLNSETFLQRHHNLISL